MSWDKQQKYQRSFSSYFKVQKDGPRSMIIQLVKQTHLKYNKNTCCGRVSVKSHHGCKSTNYNPNSLLCGHRRSIRLSIINKYWDKGRMTVTVTYDCHPVTMTLDDPVRWYLNLINHFLPWTSDKFVKIKDILCSWLTWQIFVLKQN